MSSLGPAVSVENVELPVKSTAETGYEVNQSGSYSPYTHVTVFPCPHPVLAEGEAGQEGMPLNDMESSIIQHSTDCKQFENAVGLGVGAPSSDDEVNGFSEEDLEPCADFDQEEIQYTNPVPTELPPGGIQPNDTPRRPARVAARPSRFRDDQFETEFCPGPSKYKVRQVGLDLGKGAHGCSEGTAPHRTQDTRRKRVSSSRKGRAQLHNIG